MSWMSCARRVAADWVRPLLAASSEFWMFDDSTCAITSQAMRTL